MLLIIIIIEKWLIRDSSVDVRYASLVVIVANLQRQTSDGNEVWTTVNLQTTDFD